MISHLHFEKHGNGHPILLVHGFPLNRTIWYGVVPTLKNLFTIVLPDLRGHGLSKEGEGVSSMVEMAKDLVHLMDELGIRKAVVAGHSMGGYIALEMARLFPDRLAGLGLIASHAESDTPERKLIRESTAVRLEHDGISFLAADMAPRLTSRFDLVPEIESIICQNSARGAAAASRGMSQRSDLTEYLHQIAIPTLVVAGSQDSFNPIERANKTVGALKNSRLVVVPGGGHMPMMEFPEITANALNDFCSSAVNWD